MILFSVKNAKVIISNNHESFCSCKNCQNNCSMIFFFTYRAALVLSTGILRHTYQKCYGIAIIVIFTRKLIY